MSWAARTTKRRLEERGFIVRMPRKRCPACHVPKDLWCIWDCPALDLMDYR